MNFLSTYQPGNAACSSRRRNWRRLAAFTFISGALMTAAAHAQSPTAWVELKPVAGGNMIQVTGHALALDAVEDGQDLGGLHPEAGLLLHLAHDGLLERLAELDRSARHHPATVKGLLSPPDEQDPTVPDDHAADSDHGRGRGHRAGCGSSTVCGSFGSARRRRREPTHASGPDAV